MNEVHIAAGRATLDGNLTIVDGATALVLFAHGSGSSRHSPRNQFVARTLNDAGLATLLFDLLTPEEEAIDLRTREHRFNIGLLAERLVHATKWAKQQEQTRDLRIGYFGSSTGGAAQRWLRRRRSRKMSGRWFRAAVAPIWPVKRCQKCRRRHCSSSAATTISSSS